VHSRFSGGWYTFRNCLEVILTSPGIITISNSNIEGGNVTIVAQIILISSTVITADNLELNSTDVLRIEDSYFDVAISNDIITISDTPIIATHIAIATVWIFSIILPRRISTQDQSP